MHLTVEFCCDMYPQQKWLTDCSKLKGDCRSFACGLFIQTSISCFYHKVHNIVALLQLYSCVSSTSMVVLRLHHVIKLHGTSLYKHFKLIEFALNNEWIFLIDIQLAVNGWENLHFLLPLSKLTQNYSGSLSIIS